MDRHAKPRRRVREGGRDIVAVADVGNGPAVARPPALAQRQHVGQCLARMFLIAERVNHMEHGRR